MSESSESINRSLRCSLMLDRVEAIRAKKCILIKASQQAHRLELLARAAIAEETRCEEHLSQEPVQQVLGLTAHAIKTYARSLEHIDLVECSHRQQRDAVDLAFERQHETLENLQERHSDEVCSICLDPLAMPVRMVTTTSCGHSFHHECLALATACPMCRQELMNRD